MRMTAKKLSYWERRHLQTKAKEIKNAEAYEKALQPELNGLYRELHAEMEKWYVRYGNNQGIEKDEAKKALTGINTKHWQLTLKQFEEKAKAGGHQDQLDAEYFRSRVARLQDLEQQLRQVAQPHANREAASMRSGLAKQYEDTYMRTTYTIQASKGAFTGNFSRFNEAQLRMVVSQPWAKDGKDFSKRIWKNYQKDLPSLLTDSVMRSTLLGYSPQKASQLFHASFQDFRKSDVHRLITSEMGHVAEEAAAQSYDENDIDQYEYLATLESHTCSQCGSLDGQKFKVTERKVGINYPLIHPYCRCTTMPYIEGLPDITERWSRDPETGKGKMVKDVKFNEWKKLIGDGKPVPVYQAKPKTVGTDPMDKAKWPQGVQVSQMPDGELVNFLAPTGQQINREWLQKLIRYQDDEDLIDTIDYYMGNGRFTTPEQTSEISKWIKDVKQFKMNAKKSVSVGNAGSKKYSASILRPHPTSFDVDRATKEQLVDKIQNEYGMKLVETSRTKLSELALRETVRTISEFDALYQALPDKIPQLRALPASEAKHAIAWYGSYGGTGKPAEFGLNVKYFKNPEALKETISSGVDSGWFSNNKNINHIMVHEFSHHIDRQLSNVGHNSFSTRVFMDVQKNHANFSVEKIGRYAFKSFQKGKDYTEAFAELLTEAYGPTPGEQAKWFRDSFEKIATEVLNNASAT